MSHHFEGTGSTYIVSDYLLLGKQHGEEIVLPKVRMWPDLCGI